MAQHCAVDLAHSRVLGDVPILGLGWAAPKGGNAALAAWVAKQPNLRILRVRVPIDFVTNGELCRYVVFLFCTHLSFSVLCFSSLVFLFSLFLFFSLSLFPDCLWLPRIA